jgi:ABC-type transport system involved in cytochrome c biogenesis ATPase subunit/sugar phosphate permease
VDESQRIAGRAALGVNGEAVEGSLRSVLRGSPGPYPLIAISVLAIVDQFQGYALLVLGPEVSRALHVSKSTLGALVALKILAVTCAALPVAAWVHNKPRRALVSVLTAFGWSAMTLVTGTVVAAWQLAMVLVVDGATSGSVQAVHRPLLIDSYEPRARVRVLAGYRAADQAGSVVAPLLVGLFALIGLTWRGTFGLLGLLCVAASFFALRLRDPGYGARDERVLRETVRETEQLAGEPEVLVEMGFFESVRRLLLLASVRRLLVGNAVLGMMLVPLNTYLVFFLDERWGLGPVARAVVFAILPLFAIAALVVFGRRGEALFRRNPGELANVGAATLAAGVILLAVSIAAPVFAVMVVALGCAFGCFAVTFPALETALLSVVAPKLRPHAAALSGIALAAVGGFGGLVLLGSIDRRFGITGAIASVVLPGLLAAAVLRGAAPLASDDLDRLVAEIVEEEEVGALRATGAKLPLLAVSGVEFSYDTVQVLFDVDLRVEAGEMVALLGTNGAGKSTLLRVISGLGLPSRGTVRLDGHDITFIDAERRVGLGISQVPGGKAVFGQLSVVENMRIHGWSLGRDRKTVDRRIEEALAAFPRLAERRDAPAGALSGGEQQMLALA